MSFPQSLDDDKVTETQLSKDVSQDEFEEVGQDNGKHKKEERNSYDENSMSSLENDDDSSSSNSESTVVRFEIDESVLYEKEVVVNDDIIKDECEEGDKVQIEEHNHKGKVDKEENVAKAGMNQAVDGITNSQSSLNSVSSEEAEWTENDDNDVEISISEEDEPSYTVVILSSDESISEDESFEDEESSDEEESFEEEEESFEEEEEESFHDEESAGFKSTTGNDHEDSIDSGYDDDSIIELDNNDNDDDEIVLISDDEIVLISDDESITVPRNNYESFTIDSAEEFTSESDLESDNYISTPQMKQFETKHTNKKPISKFQFQNQRELITRKSTFDRFNKDIFDDVLEGVEVSWSKRMTSTAGVAKLRRKMCGSTFHYSASIELSTKLIDDEMRLQSTLAHEMCHAAAWLVDHIHKPPHGKCFKKWANLAMRRINGLIVSTTHEYVTNTFKYAWSCTNETCDFVIQRHSRSVDINHHCCGKCRGRLVEIEVPTPESLKARVFTPKKKKAATGFSLFIQQQSKSVRAKLIASSSASGPKVSQKEVMKECGRLWRELKAQEIN